MDAPRKTRSADRDWTDVLALRISGAAQGDGNSRTATRSSTEDPRSLTEDVLRGTPWGLRVTPCRCSRPSRSSTARWCAGRRHPPDRGLHVFELLAPVERPP